jgi:hypothetical protein
MSEDALRGWFYTYVVVLALALWIAWYMVREFEFRSRRCRLLQGRLRRKCPGHSTIIACLSRTIGAVRSAHDQRRLAPDDARLLDPVSVVGGCDHALVRMTTGGALS